ncbi:MAG: hypothetical protein Sapg2KO_50950 [Saprospiraceae bacterium]
MSRFQTLLVSTFMILLGTMACKTNNSSTAKEAEISLSTEGPKQSIVGKLKENSHLSIDDQIALYKKLKKEDLAAYDFENEDQMTMYGYGFLWSNKVKEAIQIFKLIVEEFPDSYNAYDSLAEGYLRSGDKQGALVFYRKSLKMNPDNFNAEDQIEAIMYPDRKPETPAQKFVKTFAPEEYLADLDQLGQKLLEINPSTLKFISKADFLEDIEKQKAQITPQTTLAEFRWLCNKIVANVNCSHTSMGDFFFENQLLPLVMRFPLQTRWTDGRLFVIDPLNNEGKVSIKDEITSINGIKVAQLLEQIYEHIPSQGHVETTKKHVFNTWSTGYIPYALGFPESYEVAIKGQTSSVELDPPARTNDPLSDKSIKQCSANLCLDFTEDNSTAILTIRTFNYYTWNNFKEFTAFMDKSFADLKSKDIRKLIIDLRQNGGGSPESSIYLLRFLAKQPFEYFEGSNYHAGQGTQTPFEVGYEGDLFFLIDGEGNSTTGHFMAIVKDLKLGTIIGEELGSNQFCTAGQTICRLKNTKVEFYVANTVSRLANNSLPDETGILPDHYVTQGIEDYLNQLDAVLAFALDLAQQ